MKQSEFCIPRILFGQFTIICQLFSSVFFPRYVSRCKSVIFHYGLDRVNFFQALYPALIVFQRQQLSIDLLPLEDMGGIKARILLLLLLC